MSLNVVESIAYSLNPWWEKSWRGLASDRPGRRSLHSSLMQAVARPDDRRAVVLLGPRQVGKTTLLLQLVDGLLAQGFPPRNICYFDFSDYRLPAALSPEAALAVVPSGVAGRPQVLLFDEIGKADRWPAWLKNFIDRSSPPFPRVVATDSAASILTDAARESGPGRWDEYRIETLSYRECLHLLARNQEDPAQTAQRLPSPFERFLLVGGFPEHLAHFSQLEFPDGRIRVRLQQDIAERVIQQVLIGRNLDPARGGRLFAYLLQDSGAIFTTARTASDLEAHRKTVEAWIGALEGTQLLMRLPRFSPSPAAGRKSKPKLYAADHGLIVAFSPLPHPLEDPQVRARIYETAVFHHLREATRDGLHQIFFYRPGDRRKEEIDFVLDGPEGRSLVEVTTSAQIRESKLTALSEAANALKASRLTLVYGGFTRQMVAGIESIPLSEFLLQPVPSAGRGMPE